MDSVTLRNLIAYDPDTGEMTWLPRVLDLFATKRHCSVWNAKYAGKMVGSPSKNGYLVTSINNKTFYMHRIAWEIMTGNKADIADHIDGNRTNNRFNNLRNVSATDNARNAGIQTHRGTGVMGVRIARSGRFVAHIRNGEKQHHLGTFNNIEDAKAARIKAIKHFGYHENHGQRISGENYD
jgi:hypothetical protein